MQNKIFQIDIIKEGKDGYTVIVPQLPGCVSFGKTIDEAQKNAKNAIELHLENLKAHKSFNNIKSSVFSTVVQVNSSYA